MTRPAPTPVPPAAAQARPAIGLTAQVLTCLALCLIAAPIIYFTQSAPLAVFTGPVAPLWQVLIGQGLALAAAAGSYAMYRLTADSESTARTVDSYARLDLKGLNPLWISIAAAVGEEMLFRAALQPLLGIWITSLVFLVTHVPVYRFRKLDRATLVQAAGILGVSVALGVVFEYVGLIPALFVHARVDNVGRVVVRAVIRSRSA